MVAQIPVSVVRGVNAIDGNAPRRPITRYDQAIADLARNPEALTTACWAGRRVGNTAAPVDRLDGTPYTTFGTPTVIESDDVLGIIDSNGDFVGLPCFNFTTDGGIRNSQATGKYTQSWSVACVLVPDAGGNGGIAYGIGSSQSGGSLRANSTLVYMDTYFNSAVNTSVPRSRLIDGEPNIIVACADANTRQHALYVNSKTPVLSATGIGTAPWRDLSGTGDWGFGNVSGSKWNGRAYGFAAFNRSLHHDAQCLPKLLDLIDAAAETFDIALV